MDLRKASKERFEDAEPAEFLMPFKEATIFLHRNSFDNVFEVFVSFFIIRSFLDIHFVIPSLSSYVFDIIFKFTGREIAWLGF